MNDNPNYYAILTAEVRYDKRLSSSEKLFFAEVTALSNKTGKCWASNKYFAELYDVSKSTVSGWARHLCECGYIDMDYQYDGKQIKKRFISVNNPSGIHLFEGGYSENTKGGIQNIEQGYSEKGKGNITSNNTTSTNSIQHLSDTESDALEVCEHLLSSITDSDPDHRYSSNPPNIKSASWLKEVDRAIRLDGRTKEDLMHLVSIVFYDNNDVSLFWRGNIQSGAKLRQQFDQVRNQLQIKPKFKKSQVDEQFIDSLFQ